jgi:hypothetical protein
MVLLMMDLSRTTECLTETSKVLPIPTIPSLQRVKLKLTLQLIIKLKPKELKLTPKAQKRIPLRVRSASLNPRAN